MQNSLPKKQSAITILIALLWAILAAFVTILITSVVAALIAFQVSGSILLPDYILRLSMFIGIAAAIATSYSYIVTRTEAKLHVRQVYPLISLIIASSFVFSWYQIYQDRLFIKAVCIQFDQAVGQGDYETAYELMSPAYRQSYTIAQFIAGDGRFISCRPVHKDIIIEIYVGAREASIVPYPFGSLITKISLEQINHKWYFTGEGRLFQG